MQYPSVRNLWSETMNPFSESFKNLTIVLVINCLSLRYEFLTNNTLTVGEKKKINMDLLFDLLILAFFGRGELFV
jgi:hypothetical protein